MSDFPKITIAEMLENGVHYGHKSMLWNPKMSKYIYCERNGIHIIDLQQTAQLLHNTLKMVYQAIKNNPKTKILFVGTKHQASQHIKKFAEDSGQYYVDHRWLGGMLTNWNTVIQSIKKLAECEKILSEEDHGESVKYSKKELLDIDRHREKLERSLGGIRNMKGKPDFMFVIDTNKEKIAVTEARKLGIPVFAIVDTNSDPDSVDYIICGNDDSAKAIEFYCNAMSKAVLAGLEDALVTMGVDPTEAAEKVRSAIERDKLVTKIKVKTEKVAQPAELPIIQKGRVVEAAAETTSPVNALQELAEELEKTGMRVKVKSKSRTVEIKAESAITPKATKEVTKVKATETEVPTKAKIAPKTADKVAKADAKIKPKKAVAKKEEVATKPAKSPVKEKVAAKPAAKKPTSTKKTGKK